MNISILLAHAGHAGDHGWLAGALQPLLSIDHLLAGVFVAALLSVGLSTVARRSRRGSDDLRRS
jgi:hydrogenase/urease accessory protein HupE